MHDLERNEPHLERQVPCFLLYAELGFKIECLRTCACESACKCMCMDVQVCVCMCSRMGEYAFSIAPVSVLSVYPRGNQCAHACTYSVYTYV